jgi:hypothetical protein
MDRALWTVAQRRRAPSIVDSLSHHITAVDENMLPRRPLRFLLAEAWSPRSRIPASIA